MICWSLMITIVLAFKVNEAASFRKFRHEFLGLVTTTKTMDLQIIGDTFFGFETVPYYDYNAYEVILAKTNQVFYDQEKHLKCVDSSNPSAKELFSTSGTGLLGMAMRAAAKKAHGTLFQESSIISSGTIEKVEDFLDLMNHFQRKGKPRLFNFVLTQDSILRISESASPQQQMVRDLVSKHAVLSDVNEKVFCAGTMFARVLEKNWSTGNSNQLILYLANDSGTYRVDLSSLNRMKLLLQKEFPGFNDHNIIILSYNDPRYTRYLKDLK